MTTKEEVIAAIAASDARVKGLAQALLAHGTARLPESEWDVRQALCHVAARANAVPLSLSVMQRVLAARAQGQAPDLRGGSAPAADINHAQPYERPEPGSPDLL